MGEDKQWFELILERIGNDLDCKIEDEDLIITNTEISTVDIILSRPKYSNYFSIKGFFEGQESICFHKCCYIDSASNIFTPTVQAWFTTLLFKLEN